MENYIMLNGKRIDLTAEQIETLVGKKEKDPFERAEHNCAYCFIDTDGKVEWEDDVNTSYDVERYEAGNYCTDKELFDQRALHKVLDDLLFRYSMQHGGRDGEERLKWMISYNGDINPYFGTRCQHNFSTLGTARFINEEAAKAAIEEIVKPFMEKHPEFRW